MSGVQQHPEVIRLQARCSELRAQLRASAVLWHSMSTTERRRLTTLYDRHFGEHERTLQQLAIDAAEISRRVELLNTKVARGERLTQDVIDRVNLIVDKEFERFHRRLREAFDMSKAERDRAAAAAIDQPDDGELTRLYRALVKKLHPDVQAVDDVDGAWHRVQDAYQRRNISQLRAMIDLLEADDASVAADAAVTNVDELTALIATLEERLDVEQRKLDRLRREEPFCIAAELEQPDWLHAHEQELTTAITAKNREIGEWSEQYRTLTGGTIAPHTDVRKTKDDQQFDNDFMDNTYFGKR